MSLLKLVNFIVFKSQTFPESAKLRVQYSGWMISRYKLREEDHEQTYMHGGVF